MLPIAEVSEKNEVDISYMHKTDLLIALYKEVRGENKKVMTDNEAKKLLQAGETIMNFRSVFLGLNLSEETFDPTLYNEHYGPGTAERVVLRLRRKTNKGWVEV